jgi:hypothetical protein
MFLKDPNCFLCCMDFLVFLCFRQMAVPRSVPRQARRLLCPGSYCSRQKEGWCFVPNCIR